MANTYKTPGVFVEEITKFPPSVAAVETAIPAFIGYTERATEKIAGDLLGKATKITAIAEFTRFFGAPQPETAFVAQVTDTTDETTGRLLRQVTVKEPDAADKSPFLMSYQVQMYFANGGGPCYIISVGNYTQEDGTLNEIDADLLGNNVNGDGGLDLLEKEDEPTLIVFPDAQALNEGDFYTLYQSALAQCNKLKDRFVIMDTKGDAKTAPALFRNNIGTNFLKYGSVYYPFLETSLSYNYSESAVLIQHTPHEVFALPEAAITAINTATVDLGAANTAIAAVPVLTSAQVVSDATTRPAKVDALGGDPPADTDLVPVLNDLAGELTNANTALQRMLSEAEAVSNEIGDPDIQTALDAIDPNVILNIIYTINGHISSAEAVIATPSSMTNPEINALAAAVRDSYNGIAPLLNNLINTQIPNVVSALEGNDVDTLISDIESEVANIRTTEQHIADIDEDDDAALASNITAVNAAVTTLLTALTNIDEISENVSEIPLLDADLGTVSAFSARIMAHQGSFTAAANGNEFRVVYTDLAASLAELDTVLTNIQNAVNYLNIDGRSLAGIENIDNESYNAIKQEIEAIGVRLPPSSTVAGIYAQVDRDRGVWKSPANVSLTAVIQPTVKITNDIQDGLNVDAVAGKSINAIRTFTGKGTLVWGARTLAGNDNEWRYISVRRFFNFVEESVKKATEQFVFEPNDANTWTRVRAMIENFLILQWRAGALAGAKPDQAFYVRVGLGETMTALDILEGRMIVEIGMAVVRPAEFIILRFAHKMQES